jgi:hypothetical protein
MAEPNCERSSTSAPPPGRETTGNHAEHVRAWNAWRTWQIKECNRERSDAIYVAASLQSPGMKVAKPAEYWEGPRPLNGLNNVHDLVEYLEGQRSALHMLDLADVGADAMKEHVRITRENTARLARKWGWPPPPEMPDESALEALDYRLQDLKSWCERQVAALVSEDHPEELTKAEIAMLIYLRDPSQTVPEVASKAGCDSSLLYRHPKFKRLYKTYQGTPKKGSKGKDGSMEAEN